MLTILMWVVFGWIAGSITDALWPPVQQRRAMETIGIGIAGSIAGGLIGSVITGSQYAPAGLVMSVVGAILCMFVWKQLNEVPK